MVFTFKTIAYIINCKFVGNLYWVYKHREKKTSLLSALLCGASHLLDSFKLLIRKALRLLTENLLKRYLILHGMVKFNKDKFTNVYYINSYETGSL